MALTLSTALKNARLQTLADAIDSADARLVIYNAAQAVVCELAFPKPCKLSIENAVLTFNNLPESLVLMNADATHAKILSAADVVLATLNVGELASNADLKLPTLKLFQGSLLRLNGWTINEL